MQDSASRLTVDKSSLQSQQDSAPNLTSPTAASATSLSLKESISHPALDSAVIDDTRIPQVNLSLSGQPTLQTGAGQSDGLTPSTADLSNVGQQPAGGLGLVDQTPVKSEEDAVIQHVNAPVDLLESSSDNSIVSGDTNLVVQESQEWIPEPDHELKRVKVYELINQRWVDQGTAFCFGQFSEERNEALLVARSERNYEEIILTTPIRSTDVYQRQQETLIVWTEPDGVDFALSFQDPEGCADIWNFILEVQQHLNTSDEQTNISSSPLLGPDTSVTTASIINSGHLPAPQLGIISEIERAIKQLSRTQPVKERICEYIQHEEYIKSLIEVMHTAEDLENLENLHALCSLMQTILMLNDHTMYEHILEDDIFFGVVGILEYDPDFPGHKANYRDFLHNTAQFHQPVPMRNIAIQRKIHHTYRLQFLKDVVLARALDDSTFNVLNSCIIFNQMDIITHVQQDQNFLRDIVRLFVDEDMLTGGAKKLVSQGQLVQHQQTRLPPYMVISLNGHAEREPQSMDVDQQKESILISKVPNGTPTVPVDGSPLTARRAESYAFSPPDDLAEEEIALRREVILLLQQLSTMGKNIQMPARLALFRTLVDRGILFSIQWALSLPEKEEANKQMISSAGEVLSAMLDHDLNGVRGHVLKQVFAIEKEREAGKRGADKAETILEMACRVMIQSKDLSVQCQMGDAIKSWLEVPSGDSLVTPAGAEAVGKPPPRKDEPGTERFLEYFYKVCANILLKPLMELPDWKSFKGPLYPLSREQTNRSLYLCDLLYNCIEQHQFRSYLHVMSSDILSRIATLLRAKDKHLRHASFRIYRLLLKLKNANAHLHLLKHDLLKPILNLTIQESFRDNLLSGSCQEFFDIIRRENMKDLIKCCVVKHEAELQELVRSPLTTELFQRIIQRHEMNIAPRPEELTPKVPEAERHQTQDRALDREEEDYFNADEDGEFVPSISQLTWSRGSGATSPLLSNNTGMKRKRRPVVGAATKGYRPPLRTPQLTALVDYDEDEGDESTEITHPRPITPTPRNAGSPTPLTIPPISEPPPKRLSKDEDDEDNVLETLVRNNRSHPHSLSSKLIAPKPGDKRRREDDEDEEHLRRLSKPSKKLDLGDQKETPIGRWKSGDDPPAPKKIKVKLGSIGLSVASHLTTANPATNEPSVTQPGTKDGDTG